MFNCQKKTEIFLFGLDCCLEEGCDGEGRNDFCSEKNCFKPVHLFVRNCVYLPFK